MYNDGILNSGALQNIAPPAYQQQQMPAQQTNTNQMMALDQQIAALEAELAQIEAQLGGKQL